MILGIRPDIIRCSKILKILDGSSEIDLKFIWSGQHYSENMKDVFFSELDIREPDHEVGAKGENDAELVGNIINGLYKVLKNEKPKLALFLGDTNTVAGCISPAQLNIPIFHIEGCMRSYDWKMPEEKYRVMIDHLSDIIYAYLPQYKDKGVLEGIYPERIVVTGNPIVDVIEEFFLSRKENSLYGEFHSRYNVTRNEFIVMTCHRRENIDEEEPLRNIMNLAGMEPYKVLFFAGYRTQRSLKELNIKIPDNVSIFDPIGYKELLYLMDSSSHVLTDSGTIVEESCILGIPTIQARFSTERPEVYDVGSSIRFNPRDHIYSQTELKFFIDSVMNIKKNSWKHPFGDGNASVRIASDIKRRIANSEISTHSPHFISNHITHSIN